LKRVYEPPSVDDGYRVLVERLWPRGISRAKARLDAWAKDVAPSTELRQWYGHDPAKFDEFRRRYHEELTAPAQQQALADLAARARRGAVTLVYATKAGDISNAAVLLDVLTAFGQPSAGQG
jgi:uncharacterized protein YeaO (DUF488 family)